MSENDKAKFLIEEIKTSDADCGEVCVTQTQTTEVYYESGKVSMIRTNENVSANVKVIKDGKKYGEGKPCDVITTKMMREVYDVECDIVCAKLENRAGIIGAAYMASKMLKNKIKAKKNVETY